MPHFFLADNGSVRPAATLTLRRLAGELSERAGVTVEAVSLQHSDRIDPADLGGEPAQLFAAALRTALQKGSREFVLMPLFFGRSRALTSFVPGIVDELKQEFGEFHLQMTRVLYPLPEGDEALICILFDHALQAGSTRHVVLVDHGSPSQQVTRVRNDIASRLKQRARGRFDLQEAVMERRSGPEYDFNGPLLEDWLRQQAGEGVTEVLVLMQFLLPGKHAGPGGDVTEICARVMQEFPGLLIRISPLISDHPALVELLAARLEATREMVIG